MNDNDSDQQNTNECLCANDRMIHRSERVKRECCVCAACLCWVGVSLGQVGVGPGESRIGCSCHRRLSDSDDSKESWELLTHDEHDNTKNDSQAKRNVSKDVRPLPLL